MTPPPQSDPAADVVAAILAATPTAHDAYHAAAQAMVEAGGAGESDLFEWHRCVTCPIAGPCSCSGEPYPSPAVRAAIDAALGDPRPVAAVLRWLADHIDATWVQLGPLRQRHVIDVDQLRDLAAELDPDDPPPPDATEDLDPDELEAGRG